MEGCRKTARQADGQAGRQARRQIQTQMVCPTILKWIVPKRCFETVKRGTLFRNGSSWDAALKRFVPQCCCGLSCNAVLKRFVPKRCSETFHSRPLFWNWFVLGECLETVCPKVLFRNGLSQDAVLKRFACVIRFASGSRLVPKSINFFLNEYNIFLMEGEAQMVQEPARRAFR